MSVYHSSKHWDFWLNKAKEDEDYADPNIPTDKTVEALVSAFPEDPRMILEIGCGFGRLTREIKKLYPKAYVKGFDINEKVLDKAALLSGYKRSSNPTSDRVPLYYFNSGDLSGKSKDDVIYCVQVFQHLPANEKREYIRQVYGRLNPGGIFRFQYIEGDADTFLTHDARWEDIKKWLLDAGFQIFDVQKNLLVPRWTWVTAQKAAA